MSPPESRGSPQADVTPEPPVDTLAPRDNRGIHRLRIRLAVSDTARSAPLGRTRDISLAGVYLETQTPLPIGANVPLSIDLQNGDDPLRVRGEVVRHGPDGMALRFDTDDSTAARRLRRWVVDQTSVEGDYRKVEQLQGGTSRVDPIRDATRIRGLLNELLAEREKVTLLPAERRVRDQGLLKSMDADGLVVALPGDSSLRVGEEVLALVTVDFASYSFTGTVLRAGTDAVRVSFPTLVHRSERRVRERQQVPAGTEVRWPAPWDASAALSFPVFERSRDGLSFRAPQAGCLLTSGAPLVGAELVLAGRSEALHGATVRNLTPYQDSEGAWLRIGVSLGSTNRPMDHFPDEPQRPSGWRERARRLAHRVLERVTYGWYRGLRDLRGSHAAAVTAKRIEITSGAQTLVGLLDRTRDDELGLPCPLVVIVPGFAGRKEQMSFLAGTLIDGFRRQAQDVAVFRFDGTNNLGESSKDPGNERDGMHALHYTTSGAVRDVHAVLDWAARNSYVKPTRVIVVSLSMGSVATRRALTHARAANVGLWVSYMGAADAQDAVLHVSGNVDMAAIRQRGDRIGVVSIGGMLNDCDRYFEDLVQLQAGTLDDAITDMSKITADVLWIHGTSDAWMDLRRVKAVLAAPSPRGARRLQEVDSGHLPRTGDVAVQQFVRITQEVWRHVHGTQLDAFTPPVGKLAVAAESEWKLVRRTPLGDRSGWWRDYLLDQHGVGFDVLELDPDYASFMERQADLVAPAGKRVVELGAGTGNLTRRLRARGPGSLIATDLVPEALTVVQRKAALDPAHTCVVDIDGTPLSAMRRFVAGDLGPPDRLTDRIPGLQRGAFDALLSQYDDELHAVLLGRDLDIAAIAADRKLSDAARDLLRDLQLLARVATGRVDAEAARSRLITLPTSVLDADGRLPFADASADAVALSLVLSYLEHPDDVLFEAMRVLAPGGRLVVSSMLTDSESSKLYLGLLDRIAALPDDQVPAGVSRADLDQAARAFADQGAELFRMEEEGLFKFYSDASLSDVLRRRGFVDLHVERGFGQPALAVVVSCARP